VSDLSPIPPGLPGDEFTRKAEQLLQAETRLLSRQQDTATPSKAAALVP
jgi:hypothetical protein